MLTVFKVKEELQVFQDTWAFLSTVKIWLASYREKDEHNISFLLNNQGGSVEARIDNWISKLDFFSLFHNEQSKYHSIAK